MRIATLCASPQPGSANDAVLAVVEQALIETGAEVERVDGLETLPPFRPQDDPPRAVTAWAGRLASADAVVIATPEYAAGPPGMLKNALDWLVGLSTLYRTPVALLCAGSTGGAFTIEALIRTLSYQGALTVAALGVDAVRTKIADGDVHDPALRRDLDDLASTVRAAAAADEPSLLAMVTPVVSRHGVDPSRFGLDGG